MNSFKTQLFTLFLICLCNFAKTQNLHLYFERADSTEIIEMGYLVASEGEFEHHAVEDENGKEEILEVLQKYLQESKNGNIIFYIHGMMAHTKWYQKMVHNKLNQDLYTQEKNHADIVVSLVWHGTMDYPKNYEDAYNIGKSYFPLVEEIQALTKAYDDDREINFIMHSMGSRTFQGIYDRYLELEDPTWKAKNVLFVASDAPEDSFYKFGVFDKIDTIAEYIHVYKNEHDFTLGISRGLNSQDRIGLGGISDMTKVSDAISVIDVSILNDNEGIMKLTGHRYFFESPTVRKDILRVLNSSLDNNMVRDLEKDSIIARTFTLKK